ncbi:MAG: septum site-determining protein Ssd [Mycobacterium sp.]
MTTTPGLLALIAGSALGEEIDRVAAAAGIRAIHLDPSAPPSRKAWLAAAAVVVDAGAAECCLQSGLPRRTGVFLCAFGEPDVATLRSALTIGARDVLTLPDRADELVRHLSEMADTPPSVSRGSTVAVMAGRGGAGASLFSAALAVQLPTPLLLDLDPWGGGIDLLLGGEHRPGLRWPDLQVQGGRLNWSVIRDAVPTNHGISVLSGSRKGFELSAGAVEAVLDATRRAGVTTVCDLPRRLTDAVRTAIDDADLLVLVTTCDVRSCAATAAMAPTLTALNPNVGLVVRGPAPGGLRPGDIADTTQLPLLAAMRPEPLIAEKLERGGLLLRARSPLAAAAHRVADVLGSQLTSGRAA